MGADLKKIMTNLLNSLLPKRMSPKLAVVKKVYTDAGKGKYCCDVEILNPGDLERTGELYKEVPINPVWAGKDKRGVYCTLQKDIIIILNFINWDEAFPYVESIYSNQYDAFEHPEDTFLITDGDKKEIRIMKDIISIKNDKLIYNLDMTSGSEKIEITDESNTNKILFDKKGIKITTQKDTLDLSDLIELKNSAGTIKECFDDIWTQIETLNRNCSVIKTSGSPSNHNVIPESFLSAIPNITAGKNKISTIFK
ncbi:MAG: hypothetical protein JXB50_12305 [Spirochaetes bacterium]|nr:hypothetical protein [Spirochaetota bacterium]